MTDKFILEKIRHLLGRGTFEKIAEEAQVSRTTVFNVFRGVHGNDEVMRVALEILDAQKKDIEYIIFEARERGLDKQGKGRIAKNIKQ